MRNQKETSENKRSSTKSRKKKVLETCTRCCLFISFWILKEAPNKNYSNQFICTCVCVDLSFFFFSFSPFVRREYFLLSKKKKARYPSSPPFQGHNNDTPKSVLEHAYGVRNMVFPPFAQEQLLCFPCVTLRPPFH